jgi:hypothetical protein
VTENASPAHDPQSPYAAPSGAVAPQPYPTAPPLAQYAATGPLGKTRSTGTCILLFIVTLGIYSWFWYYNTHEEMKRHTGTGVGGLVALLLAVFVGLASPFISSAEVGSLYERSGQPKPVSALTGLWAAIGWIILVGPIVWFVKTNGALNSYWRARGAQ